MTRSAGPPRAHKRAGYWHLARRVPKALGKLDGRGIVILSTGIRIADDPRGIMAKVAVGKMDTALHAYWRDLATGRNPGAAKRYADALAEARTMGLNYLPARDIAQDMVTADVVRRVEMIDNPMTVEREPTVAAVLGGIAKPEIRVSDLFDAYEKIVATTLIAKSDHQKHKWRVQYTSSLDAFVQLLGPERTLKSLTRLDALALRNHWQQRIVNGDVQIDTGNKNIGRVARMFRTVNESDMLGLAPIFDKIQIPGAKETQRVAYDPAFLQDSWLADGVFAELNSEARGVIFVVMETGLRLSEACNLSKETIRLDDSIPHVQVRPIAAERLAIVQEGFEKKDLLGS